MFRFSTKNYKAYKETGKSGSFRKKYGQKQSLRKRKLSHWT